MVLCHAGGREDLLKTISGEQALVGSDPEHSGVASVGGCGSRVGVGSPPRAQGGEAGLSEARGRVAGSPSTACSRMQSWSPPRPFGLRARCGLCLRAGFLPGGQRPLVAYCHSAWLSRPWKAQFCKPRFLGGVERTGAKTTTGYALGSLSVKQRDNCIS